MGNVSGVQQAHQGRDPCSLTALSCDIDILRAGFLQRESHELTPTLDLWPVEKPIRHTATSGRRELQEL